MAYEVIERFTDRRLGRVIEKGFYPHNDPRVTAEWLERLSTKNNACGRPFLREVKEATASPMVPIEPESDIEALKAEADALGVKYHPNIGYEKLEAKILEAQAEDE